MILQGYTGAVTSECKISNGQPEVVWSSSYIDFSTGYAAATGILAGIIGRGKTGKGQLVSVALADVAMAMLGNLGKIAEVMINDSDRPKDGNYLYGAFGRDFVRPSRASD